MPIGERAARGRPRLHLHLHLYLHLHLHRRQHRRAERGFTYVLLLFSVALMGASLAALGSQWQVAGQREREAELLFRGLQIRDALQRFNALTPAGTRGLPLALDELLVDRRGLAPRHHLRRLYADPFSGQADWALLRDAAGGIVGVHSRSQRPALRQHDLPVFIQAAGPDAAAPGATASGPALDLAGRDARSTAAERWADMRRATDPRTAESQTPESAAAPPRLADWQFRIQPQLTVPRKKP